MGSQSELYAAGGGGGLRWRRVHGYNALGAPSWAAVCSPAGPPARPCRDDGLSKEAPVGATPSGTPVKIWWAHVSGVVGVNVLANSLPLNGRHTGTCPTPPQPVHPVPVYAFAIWGVIYLLLGAHVLWLFPTVTATVIPRCSTGWGAVLDLLAGQHRLGVRLALRSDRPVPRLLVVVILVLPGV